MFTINTPGPNRMEITMNGRLDSDSMRQALHELVEKSLDIRGGTLLYDVVDFHLPSLSAIAIELVELPSLLGFLKKFRRAAVLTDKVWLKRISEFEGRLFTDTEIKAFSREQRTEAQAWLAAD